MAAPLPTDVLEDDIAVSLARVMAAANKRARELGVDVVQSVITITQLPSNGSLFWRINYGPKDHVGRRGGDLVLEVDASDARVRRVQWGQ